VWCAEQQHLVAASADNDIEVSKHVLTEHTEVTGSFIGKRGELTAETRRTAVCTLKLDYGGNEHMLRPAADSNQPSPGIRKFGSKAQPAQDRTAENSPIGACVNKEMLDVRSAIDIE
jgi:hypothetical protein